MGHRRARRRRQRVAHRTLNSGAHRYDSVGDYAVVAAFVEGGHHFQVALPSEILLGGELVGEEMALSLILHNRRGFPVEVGRFWLDRQRSQVVLEWTTAVQDTEWDTTADQRPIQEATAAICTALFAGRPKDPALGIRFASDLAITERDQHGNPVDLNLNPSYSEG